MAATARVPTDRRAAFHRRLRAWGRKNRRSFPWRAETDPFRILIAEMLLQRSRSRTVAGVYETLFDRWPTPASLSRASEDAVRDVIRPLGLTSRAALIPALAKRVDDLGGVPEDPATLEELPGIGPYAANATAAVAFGQPAPVVDGVTARVYRRYFGLAEAGAPQTDRSLWSLVREVTPRRAAREWNWAVLDLAASICLPKRPRCASCPLAPECDFARGSFDVSS